MTIADDENTLPAPPQGVLHVPENATGGAMVLTHGAGGDCQSPLLVALADAFCDAGILVARYDLPFRQERPHGPPVRSAERDQNGLHEMAEALRKAGADKIFLGGHSYGGRMASMLASTQPDLVSALLLLSYPLHPPRKPEQLRTAHFPALRTPTMFVSGTRDGFGTIDELQAALKLISAKTELVTIEGAGHELGTSRRREDVVAKVVEAFQRFVA